MENKEKLEGPKVTMKMANAEGWVSKTGSKWKTMPELMLRYRASAFFGRLYAPEIMMGMQTAEEIQDVINVPVIKIDKEAERIELMIKDAKTEEELINLSAHITPEQMDLFNQKLEEINSKKSA
jgi:hypothetical protein